MPILLDIHIVTLTTVSTCISIFDKTYYIKQDLFYEICLITGEKCGRNGFKAVALLQMNTVISVTNFIFIFKGS